MYRYMARTVHLLELRRTNNPKYHPHDGGGEAGDKDSAELHVQRELCCLGPRAQVLNDSDYRLPHTPRQRPATGTGGSIGVSSVQRAKARRRTRGGPQVAMNNVVKRSTTFRAQTCNGGHKRARFYSIGRPRNSPSPTPDVFLLFEHGTAIATSSCAGTEAFVVLGAKEGRGALRRE